jgi:hypothetical protein
MPLHEGRSFDQQDDLESQLVVIVNEAFRRLYWPDEAIGRRMRLSTADESEWSTVIDVAPDSKNFLLSEENVPILYLPQEQEPLRSEALVVRTSLDPVGTFPEVRDRVWSVHPDLPLSEVRAMTEVVEGSMLPWIAASGALVSLGVFALVLAALGAFAVSPQPIASWISEIESGEHSEPRPPMFSASSFARASSS